MTVECPFCNARGTTRGQPFVKSNAKRHRDACRLCGGHGIVSSSFLRRFVHRAFLFNTLHAAVASLRLKIGDVVLAKGGGLAVVMAVSEDGRVYAARETGRREARPPAGKHADRSVKQRRRVTKRSVERRDES